MSDNSDDYNDIYFLVQGDQTNQWFQPQLWQLKAYVEHEPKVQAFYTNDPVYGNQFLHDGFTYVFKATGPNSYFIVNLNTGRQRQLLFAPQHQGAGYEEPSTH